MESKPKKYTYFIGIDVSRNELDYAVMCGKKFLFHKELENKVTSISEFISELKTLPKFTISKSVFCMEHTGFYCNHLLNTLRKVKANVVLENALTIKSSLGILRGKYDKIDAIRIAQYAYINRDELRIWLPERLIIQKLTAFCTLRNRLVSIQMGLKTPVEEQQSFVKSGINKMIIKGCKRSIQAVKEDLVELEIMIRELLKTDDYLNRLFEIVTSVPSIGFVTALQIIVSTNEFRDISNPKKFACYAEVAPFRKESGLYKRKPKVSAIANKKVKSLLHICAISAIKNKGEIREYYLRKTQVEGKPKMAVINAVRYKLILRIFACVNQNRHFQSVYIRGSELQQA
jgi:transposase